MIDPLQIVVISDDAEVFAGESAVLTCVTSRHDDGVITWMHNEQNLTNSTTITITEASLSIGGLNLTQSLLQICSVNLANAGEYFCIFSDGHLSVNYSMQLAVVGKWWATMS